MSAARKIVGLAVLTVVLLTVAAAPAWAHAGGLSPTSVRSHVLAVSPPVPGLIVTTLEDGARLRLANGTSGPVGIPPGDGHEVPASIPPGQTLTWVDGRATSLDRGSGRDSTTAAWSVPLQVGGMQVRVLGEFVAEPPPAAAVWWMVTAGVAAAVVAGARFTRRPVQLLAAAGGVTATASLAHVAGATAAVESAPPAGTFLDAAGIGLLVWPMVAVAAVVALRGRAVGVLGVCAGAGLSVVYILPDVTVFHYAVLPFAGPPALERLLVAVVLGTGAGAAIAGASVLRTLATQDDRPHTPEPFPHTTASRKQDLA